MSKHRKAILAAIGVLAVIFIAACTPQVTVKESSSSYTPPEYTYSPSPEPEPEPDDDWNNYVNPAIDGPNWPNYHSHLAQFGQENMAWTSKAKKVGKGTCEAFDTAGIEYTIINLFNDVNDDELVAAIVTGAAMYVCPEYKNRVKKFAKRMS